MPPSKIGSSTGSATIDVTDLNADYEPDEGVSTQPVSMTGRPFEPTPRVSPPATPGTVRSPMGRNMDSYSGNGMPTAVLEDWKTESLFEYADELLNTRTMGFDPIQTDIAFREQVRTWHSFRAGFKLTTETIVLGPNVNQLLYNFFVATAGDNQKIYVHPSIPAPESLHDPRWSLTNDVSPDARVYVEPLKSVPTKETLDQRVKNKQFTVLLADPSDPIARSELIKLLAINPKYREYVSIAWHNGDLGLQFKEPVATMCVWNKAVSRHLNALSWNTFFRIATDRLNSQAPFLRRRNEFFKAGGVQLAELPAVEGNPRDVATNIQTLTTEFKAHARALKPRAGGAFSDISLGKPEYPIPEEFMRAFADALFDAAVPGQEELALLIRGFLAERGADFGTREIGFSSGVHPLLANTLRALRKKFGSAFSVMIPKSYYGQFEPSIHSVGCKSSKVGLDPHETDPVKIRRQLQSVFDDGAIRLNPVRALLLQYPQNPSGLYFSRPALKAIVDFCKEKRIYLLVDEIFYETGYSNDAKCSVFELMRDPAYAAYFAKYVVGFSSLSKEFGMVGTRFGYAFSKNAGLLQKIQEQELAPPSDYALKVAKIAMNPQVRRRFLDGQIDWLKGKKTEMQALLDLFQEKGLLHYTRPQGGFFFEVDFSPLFNRNLNVRDARYHIERESADPQAAKEIPSLVHIDETGGNLREALWEIAGVKIPEIGWSGNPTKARLVYAVRELPKALDRLRTFFNAFLPDQEWVTDAELKRTIIAMKESEYADSNGVKGARAVREAADTDVTDTRHPGTIPGGRSGGGTAASAEFFVRALPRTRSPELQSAARFASFNENAALKIERRAAPDLSAPIHVPARRFGAVAASRAAARPGHTVHRFRAPMRHARATFARP